MAKQGQPLAHQGNAENQQIETESNSQGGHAYEGQQRHAEKRHSKTGDYDREMKKQKSTILKAAPSSDQKKKSAAKAKGNKKARSKSKKAHR